MLHVAQIQVRLSVHSYGESLLNSEKISLNFFTLYDICEMWQKIDTAFSNIFGIFICYFELRMLPDCVFYLIIKVQYGVKIYQLRFTFFF